MPSPVPSAPDSNKKPPSARNRSPAQSTTSNPAHNVGNAGIKRMQSVRSSTGSPMSAKGAAKRPNSVHNRDANGGAEEAKAETAAAIEDLKSRLQEAETKNTEQERQAFVLQSRLDEALHEQGKLEEKSNESLEAAESLRKENQDSTRRIRDLLNVQENDRITTMREREEATNREEELNGSILRLRESLIQRDHRRSIDGENMLSRAASFRGRSSPRPGNESPSSQPRESSQNNSNLILQKDKVIESLRLELAEAQIKLVEMENAGGGHMRDLEKMLLEARMSNAKLMEDNESYQVLLSEKTLNGDFARNNLMDNQSTRSERISEAQTQPQDPGGTSLADELETVDSEDISDEQQQLRRVESELSAQKEQNKALTLYINKIITRLLQSESFETLFVSGSLTGDNPLNTGEGDAEGLKDSKPAEQSQPLLAGEASIAKDASTSKENLAPGPSLLQRAGSIFAGRQRQRPKRVDAAAANAGTNESSNALSNEPQPLPPTEFVSTNKALPPTPTTAIHNQPSTHHLTAPTEDPTTAPSLPLRRSLSSRGGHSRAPSGSANLTTPRTHRRVTSEMPANMISSMHRGAGGPSSPPITAGPDAGALNPSGLVSPRRISGTIYPAASQSAPPLILEDQKEGADAPTSLAPETGTAEEVRSVQSDSGYGESVAGSSSKPTSEAQSLADPPSSPRAAASAALEGRPLPRAEAAPMMPERQSSDRSNVSGGGRWFSGTGGTSKDGAQAGMRPLRLVQEKAEAEEAALAEKKKANRTSFMGWFNRGSQQGGPGVAGRAGSPPQGGSYLEPPSSIGGMQEE